MSAQVSRRRAVPVGELQKSQQQDEFRRALRGLLMQPLMAPGHADFPAVRRQAERLREWFAREAGWPLHVDREGARLFKRPADLSDPTRGLPDYDRRRYVLLCLACAVLERADPQITLRLIGERIVQQAADPALEALGFAFTMRSATERRELVVVCRTLLEQGVLERVAGEEENFVQENGWQQSDALYDVHRRLLADLPAAVRGPSTWRVEEMPTDIEMRLRALVSEFTVDSEQGRRDAMRHHLTRRLLDDPVLYADTLDEETRGYFTNQRGVLASRLCEAAGLVAEQRAEGLALVDEHGQLTDVAMPAEGTEAHVTLLVAEYLAGCLRQARAPLLLTMAEIEVFLRDAAGRYGRYWRKSARAPGAERELAAIAVDRLCRLCLLARETDGLRPLPAIARFSLGQTTVRDAQGENLLLADPES
ncbi:MULTISPECIES: TIGR02678 family protein [Xanthomonas]|uniref:TIGR02678 family protein n=1 Tax=Xanthomonas cucurbitae TaxID=56453 RepID=A0A2S7DGB0_9XANT|nr:TIGR02678 family protein [Xanthomonas cucurbitae]PPU72784.1 TIGR02678 family protein [Xanthomonas cucurbitae]QHG88605.1 TIGR02678 family protein [Xanthomonas cucurbitae]WDM68003.1 TIGR02678 family protein [Xanthomonas cucurbitae]WDM71877.1 TIGR02678 family protein [Xanthomonas cucurbitae]WDM75186.1 TIGR02678 family protein [Xanthomonas cucurbitae]